MGLGVSDLLPELYRPPADVASRLARGPKLPEKATPASREERRREARNAFEDFLKSLIDVKRLSPMIDSFEIRYAAVGVATAIAVVLIGSLLPIPSEVEAGSFEISVFSQEIVVLPEGLADLVAVLQSSLWPVLLLATPALLFDAFLVVRPRQPLIWHYFCALQMLVGFLYGLSLASICMIVLINIALGLVAAAVAAVVIIVGLVIAFAILGMFASN